MGCGILGHGREPKRALAREASSSGLGVSTVSKLKLAAADYPPALRDAAVSIGAGR